jgi:hypothetical protein
MESVFTFAAEEIVLLRFLSRKAEGYGPMKL